MKCHICQSIKHFAYKCPYKKEHSEKEVNEDKNESGVNEVHITLFNEESKKEYCLNGEVFSKGILDSGCTKTVSGRASRVKNKAI